MKTKLCLMIVMLLLVGNAFGQQSSTWSKWSWMVGEWKGTGSGEQGKGGGVFSFKPDLNNKILVRRSHTE